jgi:hypothetical protein
MADIGRHPPNALRNALKTMAKNGAKRDPGSLEYLARRLGWEEEVVLGLLSVPQGGAPAASLETWTKKGMAQTMKWGSVRELLVFAMETTGESCPFWGKDLRQRLVKLQEADNSPEPDYSSVWKRYMLFEEEARPQDPPQTQPQDPPQTQPQDPPQTEPANKRKQEDDDDSGGKRARVEDGGGGGVAIAIGGVLIVLFVLMVR